MSNPYYSGMSNDAPKRGTGKEGRKDAIGTNQHGMAKVGKQEHHGGAKEGHECTPIANNVAKKMCGFGETKTTKGRDGSAVKGHTGT